MMLVSNYTRPLCGLRYCFSVLGICSLSIFSNISIAADLDNVIGVGDRKLKVAQSSQAQIDKLNADRRSIYNEYKAVNKEVEGLRVYNKQLNKQILEQRKEMERIRQTIEGVTVTQRQITPLMIRMVDGLGQFVSLDLPFLKQERESRVNRLRGLIDQGNVSVAEKFRSIMQAYQIENEYGRTIEAYTKTLNVDGADRQVNILRVGRISMVYQTPDGKYSGYWDKEAGDWVETSSGSDRSNFSQALKIANKQSAPDLIVVPVSAPETDQ